MKINSRKLFSFAVAAFMPLAVYSSGISTLSIGDIVLLAAFFMGVVTLIRNRRRAKICAPIILFLIYLGLNAFFANETGAEWLRTIRFFFYLLEVCLFARSLFDFEYALKVYKYISIFATAFLIVQFLLYTLFRYYLPGYLPFLTVTRDDLVAFSTKIYSTTRTAQRMRSIFQEPSHYASYISGCIAMLLLNKEDKYIKHCVFLTVGIAISASATGIIITSACWIIYFIKRNENGISPKKILLFFAMLLAAAIFISRSDSFRIVLDRNTKSLFEMNRFSGYVEVWSLFKGDIISILFGTGMNLYGDYLAGWSRMMYYFGIIGILIYLVPIILYCRRSTDSLKTLAFLYVMGLGTSILLGGSSMLLLCYAISFRELNRQENRQWISQEN